MSDSWPCDYVSTPVIDVTNGYFARHRPGRAEDTFGYYRYEGWLKVYGLSS